MYQFVENEYMKASEYDEFLADPTDFMIRTYYPVFAAPWQGCRVATDSRWLLAGDLWISQQFGPEVQESLKALMEAKYICQMVRVSG